MDFDRNSMTVPVQSSDYTKKFLQKDSNPTTMEVVTQTNAVRSPTDSPATTKLVYTVEEIARMLAISLRSAYNLCNSTTEFRVLRVGGSIRVPKDSFDAWLYRAGGVAAINDGKIPFFLFCIPSVSQMEDRQVVSVVMASMALRVSCRREAMPGPTNSMTLFLT